MQSAMPSFEYNNWWSIGNTLALGIGHVAWGMSHNVSFNAVDENNDLLRWIIQIWKQQILPLCIRIFLKNARILYCRLSPLWSIFNLKSLNKWFNFEWNIIIWFHLNSPLSTEADSYVIFVRNFTSLQIHIIHYTFICNSVVALLALLAFVSLMIIRIIFSSLWTVSSVYSSTELYRFMKLFTHG